MDAILFIHHLPLASGATQRNLMLLKTLNPSARVVPLTFYDGRMRVAMTPKEQWKNCDLLVYEWFNRERPKYDRYFIIEYDTFSTQSLKEFYGAAMDKPAVAASVIIPWSNENAPGTNFKMRNWHWFEHVQHSEIYKFMRGVMPICGTMFSHAALSAMVKIFNFDRRLDNLFCECRLGTLACMAGFEPQRIREDAHLFLSPKTVTPHQSSGIFHSIK